ncbi:hypothetical protein WJX74_009505 [Apatococcus lobatus]|uniref:Peptidase M43 pregnancy-associated plasma-A domain-containing protein n=1 Tax=Apatococcus lobatus TaxID=904363 RepID=A0AAW1RFJ0_9CHLO
MCWFTGKKPKYEDSQARVSQVQLTQQDRPGNYIATGDFSIPDDVDCFYLHVELTFDQCDQLQNLAEGEAAVKLWNEFSKVQTSRRVVKADEFGSKRLVNELVPSPRGAKLPDTQAESGFLAAEGPLGIFSRAQLGTLSPGLVGCTFPLTRQEALNGQVAGKWTIKLTFQQDPGPGLPSGANVYLVCRHPPLHTGTLKFLLNVELTLYRLKGSEDPDINFGDVRKGLDHIFDNAGITLDWSGASTILVGFAELSWVMKPRERLGNPRFGKTDHLIPVILLPEEVYAGTTVGGSSPRAGPLRWPSDRAAAFIRYNPYISANATAAVIAHEVGHYLGLSHESSCVGWDQTLENTRQNIKQAQKEQRPLDGWPTANVMWPRRVVGPLPHFNPSQAFQMQHHPGIILRAEEPKETKQAPGSSEDTWDHDEL